MVKMMARVEVRRGSERGLGDLFSMGRLMGTIRAVTHRVRVISGAERWSDKNRRFEGRG